ncbi:MAG: hypothetical protein LBH44_00350 [Treponema sp.]|jgi:hypothetical protein|nr:hypothetical protein [Treponema sp.]
MRGFIYRLGIAIKESGKRMAHIRPFGIPVFWLIYCPVISIGNKIRDFAASHTTVGDFQKNKSTAEIEPTEANA